MRYIAEHSGRRLPLTRLQESWQCKSQHLAFLRQHSPQASDASPPVCSWACRTEPHNQAVKMLEAFLAVTA